MPLFVSSVVEARRTCQSNKAHYNHSYLEPSRINDRPHSLQSSTVQQPEGSPVLDRHPTGSDDTALAAFAQLGALRLKAKRCIISLITRDVQYVLAESTRTLSLQSDTVHNERDALWLGTTSFPRCEGIVDAAMDEWCKTRSETRSPPPAPDHFYTDGTSPHWMIVSDVRQHPELRDRIMVRCSTSMRFFCSVPIRSPGGLVLGSYSILDDKPRFGLSVGEMEFMEDIADTIMGHLEAKRASSQRQRGDRLIKGLGLFNSGKTSLRDWWLINYSKQERGEGQRRRRRSASNEALQKERADEEFGQTYRAEDLDVRGRLNSKSPSARLRDATAQPEANTSPDSGFQSQDPPCAQQQEQDQQILGDNLTPDQSRGPDDGHEFDIARETSSVYSRASNLIRESISAEGVMFIDADFTRPEQEKRGRYKKAKKKKAEDAVDPSTSDPGSGTASELELADDAALTESTGNSIASNTNCELMGFSTKIRSSLRGFSASQKHSSLPKKLMERLVRRYPHGKVFNYHDGKSLSSSEPGSGASGTERSEVSVERIDSSNKRRSKEHRDAAVLARLISDPRSIAFIPIWDSRRERYRSGILVWNTMPNRFFDVDEDVTYLAAFGNSVMAELTRLDTLAADHAKAAFISSVSHELRSPLHGVLAGVELLQESALDIYQAEMATTISLAGRTLLDTINNILDFTKINSFTDTQRFDRRNKDLTRNVAFKSADMGEIGVTSIVDLAELTENVVNTIVTAKRFESNVAQRSKKHTRRTSSPTASPGRPSSSSDDESEQDHVSVSLDIAQRPSWRTNISPGSWTRIITNILGNAIKYTKAGLITVKLRYKKSVKAHRIDIELVIEDTGQGISLEYLRNHLYTPFMQENSHSVGTGLGLSIVKQIVEELGGRLAVESEVGRGTKVIITLPRDFESPTTPSAEANYDTAVAVPSRLGRDPNLAFLTTQGRSEQNRRERSLKANVEKTCTEWLRCQCQIIKTDNSGSPVADVFILTEEEYSMWMEMRARKSRFRKVSQNQPEPPMIILSSFKDLAAGRTAAVAGQHGIIFVNQPFGPRKMFRALQAALGFEKVPPYKNPEGDIQEPATNETNGDSDNETDSVTPMRGIVAFRRPAPTRRHSERSPPPASSTIPNHNSDQRPPKLVRSNSEQSWASGSSGSPASKPDESTSPSALEALSPNVSDMQGPFDTPPGRGNRKTILLVEDNAINMKVRLCHRFLYLYIADKIYSFSLPQCVN